MRHNTFQSSYERIFTNTAGNIWGLAYFYWEDIDPGIEAGTELVLDPAANVYHISLLPRGGSEFISPLQNSVISITPRYNYVSGCWCIDIMDASGAVVLAGIMLVPGVDLLYPYPQIKAQIGALILIELNAEDYRSPYLLGINTKLLWFPAGTEIPAI